jgi:hypothetical protein
MKNKIIEEIKSLKLDNPSDFKELKKELKVAFTDRSTDDEGHSPKNQFSQNIQEKELLTINEEALKGDKYGNTPLSLAIEEGNIEKVREIYVIGKSLSDADLLRAIAIDVTSHDIQETYNINEGVALRIYSEARDQLNLMGEDTSTIVDAYNFE